MLFNLIGKRFILVDNKFNFIAKKCNLAWNQFTMFGLIK